MFDRDTMADAHDGGFSYPLAENEHFPSLDSESCCVSANITQHISSIIPKLISLQPPHWSEELESMFYESTKGRQNIV
jgi:hypothetical protein